MKKIKLGKTGAYDIDTAQFGVQVDESSRFSDGELPSIRTFNRILNCKVEFKSHVQTNITGNLFIEFQIDNYGDGILKPSGISTSEADIWYLNISDDLQLTVSSDMLRWLLQNKEDLELEVKTNHKTAKDHIGYGLTIPMYRLMEVHMKYQYYKSTMRKNEIARQIYMEKYGK
jgi:hypothetical protein